MVLGVIGHASVDTIHRFDLSLKAPGGSPTYCGFYLTQVGIEVKTMGVVGYDFEYMEDYERRGLDLTVDPLCRTTRFEWIYDEYGSRRGRLLTRCRDMTISDVAAAPRVVTVDPIVNEISLELISEIRERADYLGVDVQGFVRGFLEDGTVITANRGVINHLLAVADLVKASDDEIINDVDPRPRGTLVITMGHRGAFLISDMRLRFRGFRDPRIRDPTGAGDVVVCTMTYLLSKGEDLRWSFAYSNALAILKSMNNGPYGIINKELLEEIIERIYRDITVE